MPSSGGIARDSGGRKPNPKLIEMFQRCVGKTWKAFKMANYDEFVEYIEEKKNFVEYFVGYIREQ